MKIRTVHKTDYPHIYQFVKTAFSTAEVKDGTEQDFVLQLRAGDTFIPELEFIAEDETGIIGHIMMTQQVIETSDQPFIGVLVAPLSVEINHRNQGIGQALMKHAFQKAIDLGYTAAFLVGNPAYYQRFGYRQTDEFGIVNQSEIPDQFVLACEIIPDALKNISGKLNIH